MKLFGGICVSLDVYVCEFGCVCVFAHVCVCVWAFEYMCGCVYVCLGRAIELHLSVLMFP